MVLDSSSTAVGGLLRMTEGKVGYLMISPKSAITYLMLEINFIIRFTKIEQYPYLQKHKSKCKF